jgi:serine/threonine protein phosphatase 1
MNFLIIGDIHGCYYTLQRLLKKHWDKESERVLFLGDYVNKGKHSFKVLAFLMELKKRYGSQIILLKGNNEVLFEKKYRIKASAEKRKKFEKDLLDFDETLDFLSELPHYWENDFLFASHAGVPKKKEFPLGKEDLDLLINRKSLANIGKTQVLGHIVVAEPLYDKKADAWYLDTGAAFGEKLTAAKVNAFGILKEIISVQTDPRDV